jgi:hypothetical protein
VVLRREERQRRRGHDVRDCRQLVRRLVRPLDERRDCLRRRRQDEHAAGAAVVVVQAVLELGHDAEVAASAADRPEEIRVIVRVDVQDAPVGGDDACREQAVDREPLLANEVADAAAEGQSSDPDRGRVAEADREPVLAGRLRHLPGGQAGGRGGDARVGVDLEAVEPCEVEHEAAFGRAVPGHAVPAAADGELEAGLARELDDGRDRCVVDRAHDRRGSPVHRRQEDAARSLVGRVVRADHLSGEFQAKPPQVERCVRSGAHGSLPFHVAITVKGSPPACLLSGTARWFSEVRLTRTRYESRKRNTASTRR